MKKINIIIFAICLVYMGYRVYFYNKEIDTIALNTTTIIEEYQNDLAMIVNYAQKQIKQQNIDTPKKGDLSSLFGISEENRIAQMLPEEFQTAYPQLTQQGFTHISIYPSCVMILQGKNSSYQGLINCNDDINLTPNFVQNGIIIVNELGNGWFVFNTDDNHNL